MLRAKIHRATVTDACLEYEGSLTVDETLLEAAGILPYEAVVISNLNNGERVTTYVIPGARGSGTISLNGPTARKGDRKSTRLNSSHGYISYAVFCLKKKKNRISFEFSENRLAHDTITVPSTG